MPTRLGPWRGDGLIRHLAARLDSPAGVADLGTRTFSALLAARPHLLQESPARTASLAVTTGQLLDSGRMSPSARQALGQVWYALQLHTR
jgi:hypothetical protein